MQAEIHPSYEPIVFRDLASGVSFLTRATITSDKTIEWEDGKTYPVHDVEISSESHPFYTGKTAHHGCCWPRRAIQRSLQELQLKPYWPTQFRLEIRAVLLSHELCKTF